MKNLLYAVLLAMMILTANNAPAENSFLYARTEIGEKTIESQRFGSSYNILETDSIPGWSLGSKIIIGNKGFHKLNPHILKNVFGGWQLGARYTEDSFKNQSLGPVLRFRGKIWKFFTIIDYTHDFDLKGGETSKDDCWLFTKTTNPDFNFGFEVWYYNFLSGSEFWEFRPIRVNYKWKNFDFFIMPNFVLKDSKLARRTVMVGLTIPFDVK